jgi:hypothetical protein
MQAGAEWFASQFTAGYDEVGLVVFSSSGLVAYPTTHPWVNNPAGAGGPDTAFATNPQTMPGPIFTSLNAMAASGGTGTPEALSMAWIEMQKAHNRDLAANGSDNTLNTIVLFTDGVPDSVATYLNDPTGHNNVLKPTGSNADTQTPCTYNPAASGTPSTQMRGYIVAGGYPLGPGGGGWSGSYGLGRLASLDSSQTLTWWLGTGAGDLTKGDPTTALVNCAYLNKTANGTNDLKDILKIPDNDLYGNATNSVAFANSVMYDGTNVYHPNTTSYNQYTPTSTASPATDSQWNSALAYQIAAASWNATDAIGKTIRTQNIMKPVTIYTIGYSGNAGGTDIGLLQRLANTPPPGFGILTGSTSYVASEPNGQFYLAKTTADLIPAFNAIASTLLRLSY